MFKDIDNFFYHMIYFWRSCS